MSSKKSASSRSYETLDQLSTSALEELLRQDAECSGDDAMDTETIFYILDLLLARETPDPELPDVETAWQDFLQYYLPAAAKAAPEAPEEPEAAPDNAVKITKPKRHRRLRVLWAAAALVAVLLAGTVTIGATGQGLWGAAGVWSDGLFHFVGSGTGTQTESAAADSAACDERLRPLRDALIAEGIENPLIPTYLPEGYVEVERHLGDFDAEVGAWDISYEKDNAMISVGVYRTTAGGTAQYEMNDEDPKIYTVGEKQFYYFLNMDIYTAVWSVDGYEYSVSGVTTEEELLAILDSV